MSVRQIGSDRLYRILLLAAIPLITAISFTGNENTFSAVLIITLVCTGWILSFFSLKIPNYLLVFSLPFSIKAEGTDFSVMLPSEPLLGIILIAFCFQLFYRPDFLVKLISPIAVMVCLWLLSGIVSSLFSSMQVVSVKRMLMSFAYVMVYFFLPLYLFRRGEISITGIIYTYGSALCLVAVFILIKHGQAGFAASATAFAAKPFYADHTIYSACLCMVLPFFVASGKLIPLKGLSFYLVVICAIGCALLLVAVFLTYSRAAWISLVGSILIVLAVESGMSFRTFIFLLMTGGLLLFINVDQVSVFMKRNRYDSNARNATLEDQTKSVTNISNDQSNAERINRWKCAIRMTAERPLTGFGPGTYQFQYLSFQRKKEMTPISVKTPFNHKQGKGGSAHSEYLLYSSENGLPGGITFTGMVLSGFLFGFSVLRKLNGKLRWIGICVFSGFTSYAIHAVFNNFLDTDKAAMLFLFLLAAMEMCRYEMQNFSVRQDINVSH